MLHKHIIHMASHGNKNQHKANRSVVSIKNQHWIKCSQELNLVGKLETASVLMSHWSKIYTVSHKCSQVFPLPKSYKCFHSAEKTLVTWAKTKENKPVEMTHSFKVSKGAKIRNRYNQVPHLTQDTNGKVTNSQQTPQTRAKRSALSQQVTTKHIETDAHKDIANTRQNKNIKDPQKKYRLGIVSKIFYWRA